MTILGRIISFFPLIHFMGFIIFIIASLKLSLFFLGAALFWLYILPLILNRIHGFFYPLCEESQDLSQRAYSAWWGVHQLQYLFIVIPQFEGLLHLVPGLYSLWLRSWGSQIGKNVFWTPRVEILDRGLVEIGDHVIIGHLTTMSAHMVADIQGRPHLIIKKIRIGAKSFIGADSQFGPGTTVEPETKVRPKTRLWWRGEYQ
jgi:hypothetical protein